MTEQRSLVNDFRSLMEHKPDPCTLAWWKRELDELKTAYGGNNHLLNLAVGNTRDNIKELKKLSEVIQKQAEEIEALKAVIGSLRADVVGLTDRIAKMAEWAKGVKK